MLFRRQVEQVIRQRQHRKTMRGTTDNHMDWWDLSLIGIGAVIGAGFFLGTALSIQRAGPSILLVYIVGGMIAFKVFSALADMSVRDPQEGSFRVYARKAFGPYMGFVSGWMYWLAGVLIMSTEVTALSIFSQFWFPTVPLWIFAVIYSILALAINLLGVQDFGRIESLFGLLKISSLVIFILFGIVFLLGGVAPPAVPEVHFNTVLAWFPHGLAGTWSAMIFVLFSYGGIEVMGILSHELKQYNEIGKSGKVMLAALTAVYASALLFIFLMVSWQSISTTESPFVTVLSSFGFTFADSLLNVIIISAAFSTMVGALFGVTNVMVSLADDLDAPLLLAWRNQNGVPTPALFLTALGLVAAIIMSFLLPNTVYEYLATAAGVMLILNWIIILASQNRLAAVRFPYASYLAIGLIIVTITGATLHTNERIGVVFSLTLACLILIASRIRQLGGLPGGAGFLEVLRKRLPE